MGWSGGPERTDLNSFYFQRVWWSGKNWFSTISILGGCDGLERTHFEQFLLWEGVLVMKEFNFEQFLLSEAEVVECGGMVVMKELILNSFYFQRVWWS